MDQIIGDLIKKHKTNCPFTIAENRKIKVVHDNLGNSTRGLYYTKLRRRYIVIHNKLCPNWQRLICAHELGHDVLHSGISHFWLDEHSFFNVGKFERQANTFAVHLLAHGDMLQPGESVSDLLRRNYIPEEMQKFYF
ncbi:ImmA/IrrE family metallo-endopeptidase [Paenibacillus dendritiformis]|uniref:ImmA/IrrE family metallo-endopeptidase n=1 Tax=Paenibacillus dendritiformis TaxID=130049 RepID=UPI001BCB9314|nr:ImmA/IrrE family metallo-endopeptidase [Paenibacillus dendritiformis]